eukprot:16505-Heterococcus_DN1.PRE.4
MQASKAACCCTCKPVQRQIATRLKPSSALKTLPNLMSLLCQSSSPFLVIPTGSHCARLSKYISDKQHRQASQVSAIAVLLWQSSST